MTDALLSSLMTEDLDMKAIVIVLNPVLVETTPDLLCLRVVDTSAIEKTHRPVDVSEFLG